MPQVFTYEIREMGKSTKRKDEAQEEILRPSIISSHNHQIKAVRPWNTL
jgi:hypothetical protein